MTFGNMTHPTNFVELWLETRGLERLIKSHQAVFRFPECYINKFGTEGRNLIIITTSALPLQPCILYFHSTIVNWIVFQSRNNPNRLNIIAVGFKGGTRRVGESILIFLGKGLCLCPYITASQIVFPENLKF